MAKAEPTTASSDWNQKLMTTPIAIVGLASIFPKARELDEYWNNILEKIDCVIEVPSSRWEIQDYYDPDPRAEDKTYCKRGGFIPDVEFDPMEFGLPPNILEVTDVSQLLALVVAKEALEDAGYGEERDWKRDRTGAIFGVVGMSSKLFTPLMARLQYPVWEKALLSSGISKEDAGHIIEKIKKAYVGWEENSFPGTIANVISGRVANRFDLGATNCVVDAACASSLAAIRMAVSELIEGRADMMLTGGVDADNSISTYMCFSKTPAFSKGEHVRPFDAEADGMMAGEGLGMVVLKRLADAERDGDRIYAVIKGIGSSSDGRFKSIYAPRSEGQAQALRRAYLEAGFDPSTVGLVEAHGTGTMAGDPAEFAGLNMVFSESGAANQSVALGSVKSQIAHTKSTAGAASLIKVALSLHHKILPPTINVNKPNPKLDIENTPFYVNSETRPWIRSYADRPRRAGVSAFGFGGTNFHVALEEYQPEHQGAYRLQRVPRMVVLSAPSANELVGVVQQAVQQLQSENGDVYLNQLDEAARAGGIPAGHARLGFTAASAEEARQMAHEALTQLSSQNGAAEWEHPKGITYRSSGMDVNGKVVALFSGQGSQYVNMGRELALNFPPVRQAYADMDALFLKDERQPLSQTVYPIPVFDSQARDAQSERLTRTENAQPAIGTFSVALYRMLQQAGFQPNFSAGHSFGELTALWAAGVLNDEDYFNLARARGKAMAPPADPNFDAGTMLAVKGDAEQVKTAVEGLQGITLANWNSNNQVVLAGSKPDVAAAQQALSAQGFSVVALPVSAAFHTPLVEHAQKPFAEALEKANFKAPAVPVYSNTTAKAYPADPKAIRKTLAGHILQPVLFRDEIEQIYAAGGRVFIEFGPKNVLTNLVGNILDGKPHTALALNANAKKDSDRQIRDVVVRLLVLGMDLKGFDPYAAPRKGKAAPKKKGMSVTLTGGLYMSDKTRAAYEAALNDGFQVRQAQSAAPAAPLAALAPVARASIVETPAAPQPAALPIAQPTPGMEQALQQFFNQQSETLQVHQQYLQNDGEYARLFTQLAQAELNLFNPANSPQAQEQAARALESLERSLMRFHDHQAETLKAHQQYLSQQMEAAQTALNWLQQQAGAPAQRPAASTMAPAQPTAAVPVAVKPLPISQAALIPPQPVAPPSSVAPVSVSGPALPIKTVSNTIGADRLKASLLDVVSEKTGYPIEMLEMDMDMEADLGIDSIKRVEILGAMQSLYPELPKVEPEALAELRTLGHIVRQLDQSASVSSAVQPTAEQPVAAPVQALPQTSDAVGSTSGVSAEQVKKSLLDVVSEKTGYPVEMLELDMDMEADLGIDSIKRVEILGAMQTLFPELPKVEPDVLAELRTLGHIIGQLSAASPLPAAVQVTPAAAPPAPVEISSNGYHPAGAVDVEKIHQSLLGVVSEKTGYPVEMLELDMDMEADLGIDSIKRVEILGAMQLLFPELPKVEPDVLAELRTLGQIIQQLSRTEQPSAQPRLEVADSSPFDQGIAIGAGLSRREVVIKPLPAPDSIDFQLAENQICLLTDDGSQATYSLVRELIARNMKVVVLGFPGGLIPSSPTLPEGVQRVFLTDCSEPHLQEQLADIESNFGQVALFIHLNPQTVTAGSGLGCEADGQKAIVRTVFLLAKHLKHSLGTASQLGRSVFMSVVRLDGAFGLGGSNGFDPISGGLAGLVKTLNLEWEAVFCRAVDFNPDLSEERMVELILAELYDPNRLITEVGYTAAGRCTLVAAEPETQELQS